MVCSSVQICLIKIAQKCLAVLKVTHPCTNMTCYVNVDFSQQQYTAASNYSLK